MNFIRKSKILLVVLFVASVIGFSSLFTLKSASAYPYERDNNFYNGAEDDLSLTHLRAMTTDEIMALPVYDSTDYGIVTGIENQTGRNTCWSFGTASASATSILREGLTDLDNDHFRISADNIAYTTFNRLGSNDPLGNTDYDIMQSPWNNGNNIEDAAIRLMQWNGPLVIDPSDNSFGAEYYERPQFILENYEVIPGDNIEGIKRAIATHGAVATSYDTYMGDYIYYNSNGATETQAHAVSIIGWNDNLSPDLFYDPVIGSERPSQPGGWLMKNSWGGGFHYYGYFFISYDSPLGNCISFDYAKNQDNRYNYFYDGLTSSSPSAMEGKSTANIFRSKKASDTLREFLDSVNVTIYGNNATIDVKVYKGVEANFGNRYSTMNNPVGKTLLASATRTVDFGGAYTIDLDNKVELLPDETFSIVVDVTSADNSASVALSRELVSNNDMSFYLDDGTWKNCYNINQSVARIKAFTHTEQKSDKAEYDIKNTSLKLSATRFTIGKDIFTPLIAVTHNGKTLVENTDYTVNYILYNQPENMVNELYGYYEVKVSGMGKYTGSKSEYYQLLLSRVPDIAPVGRYITWDSEIEMFVDSSVTDFNEIRLPDFWEFESKSGALVDGDNVNRLIYNGKDKDLFMSTSFKTYVVKKGTLSEDISGDNFSIVNNDIADTYIYKGVPVTPETVLYKDGLPLTFGEDYGIEFKNNNSSGRATAIIYGKGNYKGTREYSFNIGKTEEHDYISVVTEPTCTERGFTTHTCSKCGHSYVDSYVDPLGHNFGDWVVVKEPTTTETGLKERQCKVCHEKQTEVIPKLDPPEPPVPPEPPEPPVPPEPPTPPEPPVPPEPPEPPVPPEPPEPQPEPQPQPEENKGGCGSHVSGGIIPLLSTMLLLIIVKKFKRQN